MVTGFGLITAEPLVTPLRGELLNMMSGTVFVFIGLLACCFAAIRRRGGVRIFVWLGLWSTMYGARLLMESSVFVTALPQWIEARVPSLNVAITYAILPVAFLAWMELSVGKLKTFLRAAVLVTLATGVAGLGAFSVNGSGDRLVSLNSFVTDAALAVLAIVVSVPRLARKSMILPNRTVLVVGTLVFATEALYFNLSLALHYKTWRITGTLGFAALLFALGFVAVQIALEAERRLLTIDNELAIAHEIQTSILPASNPELRKLAVATAYRPMTAVAGDFYDFVHLDEHRIGILVADVTGHGVPAAIIASMIKVAMQSVAGCANQPGAVLAGLNRVLSCQARAQLISAAYLWFDTEKGTASYSAAGHPPLLRCRTANIERIVSNGTLLGVLPNSDYPVQELPILAGDRFLLYTDGVIESENAKGEPFGEYKLEEVVQNNRGSGPAALLSELLNQLQQWRPEGSEQQDDITLVVVDVVS